MHGGLLDAIPPQAAFMMLGLPSELYVPMMSTGEGSSIVCAGRSTFMTSTSLIGFDRFWVLTRGRLRVRQLLANAVLKKPPASQ
jgi:hypothetical protein